MARRSSYSKRRKLKFSKGSRSMYVSKGYRTSIANGKGRANEGGGLVLPTANDRLALWVSSDTSDQGAGTIDDTGGSVSEWRDPRDASKKYTQATGGLQPTTGAVTLNGKNVISASGGSLMVATGLSIDPTLPVYVFQVGQRGTGATSDEITTDLTGTAASRIALLGRAVARATNTTAVNLNFGNPITTGSAVLVEQYHINTLVASGTEFDRYVDGVRSTGFPQGVSSDAFTTQTLTTSYLFDDSNGGNALTGYVAESRIYNGTLTAGEITAIRSEMNATWGL